MQGKCNALSSYMWKIISIALISYILNIYPAAASTWTLRKGHQFLSVDYQANFNHIFSKKLRDGKFRKEGLYVYYGYGVTDTWDLGFKYTQERMKNLLWKQESLNRVSELPNLLTSKTINLWTKKQLFDHQFTKRQVSHAMSFLLSWQDQLTNDAKDDSLNYRNSREVLEFGLSYGVKFSGSLLPSRQLQDSNLPYSNQHHFFSTSLIYSKIFDGFYDELHWQNTLGLRLHPFSLLLLETFTTVPIYEASNSKINLDLSDRVTKDNAQLYYIQNGFYKVRINQYEAVDNNTKLAIASVFTLSKLLSVKLGYEYTAAGRDQGNQALSFGLWYSW